MKFLCVLILAASSLLAQVESVIIDFDGGIIDNRYVTNVTGSQYLESNIQYSWELLRDPNGDKTFKFTASKCVYTTFFGGEFLGIPTPTILPACTPLSQSAAEDLGPIAEVLPEFYSFVPEVPHHKVYGPFAESVHPRLTGVQPASPVDPQMIMLDGLGNSLFKFDLNNFSILSQVVVPTTSGPLGIRPTSTGPENEVWVANGGLEVTLVDLGAQKVITNIPTPSIPVAVAPAAIVFSKSGATALEAVKFFSPDSSGNKGALLVFDAVNRKVTATLLVKIYPAALVMAPDGLTAYLLGESGEITYYDVLSGTADLTLSTYTPGQSGGFPGSSQVFIHPDGTRLFWHIGAQLEVFDLTKHKVTYQFNSGLPSTSPVAMQMSQDGSNVWMNNALGKVVVLDTRYGNTVATFQGDPNSAIFPGPVIY